MPNKWNLNQGAGPRKGLQKNKKMSALETKTRSKRQKFRVLVLKKRDKGARKTDNFHN